MTIQNTQYASRNTQYAIRDTKYVRQSSGSALILAVVLTSLLAVIGVAFLLSSRIDSIATSALAENKELNLAIDTVIAKISEQLVVDTPGIIADEYYDYPDSNNSWLASLEPEVDNSFVHFWRKISDIYESPVNPAVGLLDWLGADPNNWTEQAYFGDHVSAYNLRIQVIPDSHFVTGAIGIAGTIDFAGPADADGDGVADSRWIRLPDMTSGKGKPIYAAVRVIDNSAMLNVNTAYKFDPNDADGLVYGLDGSSQTNINLLGLSQRDQTHSPAVCDQRLLTWRAGLTAAPNNISVYEQDVVWNYDTPKQMHTPFDISDEMDLRNRYILNYKPMASRIEPLWTSAFAMGLWTPVTIPAQIGNPVDGWFPRVHFGSSSDPNLYDYRHIATIHNMDRVFRPNSQKMFNVNRPIQTPADQNELFQTIKTAFAETIPGDVNFLAAQTTVNLIDYHDADANVTVIDANTGTVYGFEQPCVYISELAQAFAKLDPNDPNSKIIRAFAIELHKPYWEDNRPADSQWRLSISDTFGVPLSDVPIIWSGSIRYHVMKDDPYLLFPVGFSDVNAPNDVNEPNDPVPQDITVDANLLIPGTILQLSRFVPDANTWLTVDTAVIPDYNTGWPAPNDINVGEYSSQRDITRHKCIRRLWDIFYGSISATPTLGGPNLFVAPDGYLLQAHPLDIAFTNIGEIGALFRVPAHQIGFSIAADELNTRLNLADPAVQNIFKYLTVMDPFEYGHPDTETRVKGRININTAPWFVLAQLPWVSPELAQAIVAYRDKLRLYDPANNLIADYADRTVATGGDFLLRETAGFQTVGELANVANASALATSAAYSIRRYAIDPNDLLTFPDLTPADDAINDFEERDVIFSRISNLVTVRSDIFTAYILVRIGRDGPQKRVIAILDRSEVSEVTPTNTKVKLIALHPVPDPR